MGGQAGCRTRENLFSGRTYGFYNIHLDLVIRLLIDIELIISYECTSYLVEVYCCVVRCHKSWPWLGPGLQLVRQTFWNLVWVLGTFIFKKIKSKIQEPAAILKNNVDVEILTSLECVVSSRLHVARSISISSEHPRWPPVWCVISHFMGFLMWGIPFLDHFDVLKSKFKMATNSRIGNLHFVLCSL